MPGSKGQGKVVSGKKSFMSKPKHSEGNSAQTWATEAKHWAADWSVWTEQEFEYRKQAALAQSRGKERDQKNEVT